MTTRKNWDKYKAEICKILSDKPVIKSSADLKNKDKELFTAIDVGWTSSVPYSKLDDEMW